MRLEGGDNLTMRAVGAGIDGGPNAQQKRSSAVSATSVGSPPATTCSSRHGEDLGGPLRRQRLPPEEEEAVDRNTGQAVTLALLHTRVRASSSTSLGHSSHHNHMVARKTNMQVLDVGE